MLFIRGCCHCITPHKVYCTSYSTPTPCNLIPNESQNSACDCRPAFTWHDRHLDWRLRLDSLETHVIKESLNTELWNYHSQICCAKESHQSQAMKDLRSATFDAKLLWWTDPDALLRTKLQLSAQDAWPKSISETKVTCNPYVQTAQHLVCNG